MTTFYSTKSNANRAAKKAAAKLGNATYNIVTQKDGTFAYELVDLTPEPTTSGRGGGRKFMTGKQIRRSEYQPFTNSDMVFQICNALCAKMDLVVPYRSHVEEMAVRIGINPATARAAYTHWKQVRRLDHKAGRPTPEAEELFETFLVNDVVETEE